MAVLDSAELLLQAVNYSGSGDWLDESGNGHDAAFGAGGAAPTFVSTPTEKHFTFDGIGQFFSVPDSNSLDFNANTPFTLMAWITSWTGVPSSSGIIAGKRLSGGSGDGYMLYETSGTGKGRILTFGNGTSLVNTTDALSTSKSVLTGVRDTTANTLITYVDGTPNEEGADSQTSQSLHNSEPFSIGALDVDGSPNGFWKGSVYAVALWRSILSAADVATATAEMVANGSPPSTGATMGAPGTFTPPDTEIPADFADLEATITADPLTFWDQNTWVVLGDASLAYWDSADWQVGKSPGPASTGATMGSPGTFTPSGSDIPADFADLVATVTADPVTTWTPGTWVVLGDATLAYWDGTAWQVGVAPATVRQDLVTFIKTIIDPEWQVYDAPPDVLKLPALVVNPSDPYAVPFDQGGPLSVLWGFDLVFATSRVKVDESLARLEAVASSLWRDLSGSPNTRWVSFGDIGTTDVNDVPTLTATLTIGIVQTIKT